jgi:hypothetical protein
MNRKRRIINMSSLIIRALVSGTVAAVTTTLTASLAGRRITGSFAAPLNATSHVIWGEAANQENTPSFKYTGTGYLLNHGATVFWAVFYELLTGRTRLTRGQALGSGALVAAAAYVVDYHVVPKRLTPGFEQRLPEKALALIYVTLAAGLCIRDLIFPPTSSKAKALEKGKRILH